jgi:hypothetical protein
MIWLDPWAWLGIAGVALPILIHLLGRGHARVLRFPTLRFIDASRLLPTKRSRIQDPLLLAVRMAIVALAAFALAQPLLLTAGRREALDRGIARAIIVDTSASMRRLGPNGAALVDSARGLASSVSADARTSIIVESSDPAGAIRGAVAWMARQERRSELVVISDFQRGQMDRADFDVVARSVGIALHQLSPADTGQTVASQSLAGGRVSQARALTTPNGTEVQWSSSTAAPTIPVPVELYAGPGDSSAVAALRRAVAVIPLALPLDTSRSAAVIFARYRAKDALLASVKPPSSAWELSLLASLREGGFPILIAGDAVVGGKERFVVLTDAEPLSLDAARLVSVARRALSGAPAPGELDPTTLSADALRSWERAPAESSPAQNRPLDDSGPSDGRWIWVVVLALLLVETWLRRREMVSAEASEDRARAA